MLTASLLSPVLAHSQQPFDFPPVKADDHLAIDDRDRGCSEPQLLQFLQRLLVFPNILFHELHTPVRKKLFLLVAGTSARLGIDDYFFRHVIPLL